MSVENRRCRRKLLSCAVQAVERHHLETLISFDRYTRPRAEPAHYPHSQLSLLRTTYEPHENVTLKIRITKCREMLKNRLHPH